MTKFFFLATVAVLSVTASSVNAQAVFNEAVDGDLSFTVPDASTAPITPTTSFSFTAPGTQTVIGTTIDADQDDIFNPGGIAGDLDVFELIVGPGVQIDSVTLDSFGGDGLAFIGLVEGSSLAINPTLGPENQDFETIASGLALVGIDDVGEILDDLNTGVLGQAPAFPLTDGVIGEGTFVFSVQNTGAATNDFSFIFTASTAAIPEPSSMALLSLAAFGLTGMRRRRK